MEENRSTTQEQQEEDQQRHSRQRAWSDVQRFLLDGDWIDTYNDEESRDYGYLHGHLRRHPALAADRFGGYRDGATPFYLMKREIRKKAFPLAFLLAARAPLDVIEEVYEMSPRAIIEKQGEEQGLSLHIACSHGASLDVILFLANKNKQAVKEYDRDSNLPIHLAAKSRHRATDQLQVFQLLLERHPSSLIKKNVLGVSPLVYAIKNEKTEEPVMTYLVQNLPTDFHQIQLFGSVVAENLTHVMPKLRAFSWRDCNILDRSLHTIFTSAQSCSISLINCKLLEGDPIHEPQPNVPGIRQLTLHYCAMKTNTFRWLLDEILRMPNLASLTLTSPTQKLRAVNITDFCLSILRTGSLSYFSMDGHALTLQRLIDVLKNENTTTYVEYKNNVHDPRVRYYSTMNRFGRAAAQDPNTSTSCLVEHLTRLKDDTSIDLSFKTIVT